MGSLLQLLQLKARGWLQAFKESAN